MALVLAWENPPGLIDLNVRKVTIRKSMIAVAGDIEVTDDACWGMAVDPSTSSPSDFLYEILYLGPKGEQKARVSDEMIQRWVRPAESCLITWDLTRPDGSPDSNRVLEISDRHKTGNYIRRMATNHNGKALFVAAFGQRLTYFLEGDLLELDAVAPRIQEVTHTELTNYGSQVIRDRRAWF